MRINTNVSSLTAQDAAQNTSKSITSSLEKLSTGLRINKASDDASGLAIADKLRTQATSINQGIANGNSAVTLLQIADKSMAEQSNILDTIKAKLIQANTDTTSDDGREAIRKDISKLLEQLDNIAEQTNYNGNVLLQSSSTDTSKSNALKFQIGETNKDIVSNSAIQSNTKGLGGGANVIYNGTSIATGSSGMEKIGTNATMQLSSDNAMVFETVATSGSGMAEKLEMNGQLGIITAGASGITISNVDAETAKVLKVIAAIASGPLTYTTASDSYTLASGASIDLKDLNVGRMQLEAGGSGTISITATGVISVTNLDDTDGNTTSFSGDDITGGDVLSSLSALKEGELSKAMADKFQSVVDHAITDLNGYRGDIGSTQNQVESAVRNLMTQATNVKAAESIIRDVDYAQESANFNKQNIISQAGSYAISQANAVQQNVLRLLQ